MRPAEAAAWAPASGTTVRWPAVFPARHPAPEPAPGPVAHGTRPRQGGVLLHDVRWPLTDEETARAYGGGAYGEPEPRLQGDGLGEHFADLGARPSALGWAAGEALLAAVDAAGLSGHGGAHVPVAVKWRAARQAHSALTVVANGAESEPLSVKDATLLRQRPHLVLDGLALAAEALDAGRVVVWLHGADGVTRRVVQAAVAERRAAGEPGPLVEVVSGPSHYLAGESSAIAAGLDGRPALPTVRRPAAQGAPRTLVHNVETLARLALLARGLPSMDTVLVTVVGPGGRHVSEVDRGSSLVDVLHRGGWPWGEPPAGVLLGGFGGAWAAWADLQRATVDEHSLRAVGLSLGAGILAPLPAGVCPVAETAAMATYLASMSARQCGPCLFGLPAVASSVRRLADSSAPRGERRRLVADLRTIAGRGACHHPDGVVRLVGSLLTVFGEHVEHHARGRRCSGVRMLPVPETP